MSVRNILAEPPASAKPHALLDAGGVAVLMLTLALFVAPAVLWAVNPTGAASRASTGFEFRILVWCVLLALALAQIILQIRRFGGGAVRSNRARFRDQEGAAGRLARAHRNLIENLVPFAAALSANQVFAVSTRWTVAASAMFLGARLVHAIAYGLSITVIRSAAFYAGLIAIVILATQFPTLTS